jgi:MFS family permease
VQAQPHRRDLPVLAAAIGVSALGDWLALLPLNLQLRSMGGSGLTVAALFIAVWSPAVLLAAPAGALADRVDRRRLLVAASLGEAGVAVALGFAGSPEAILPLAAVLGTLSAIATPAEFSLVPAIVAPEGVRRANGWVETARYAGFIGGPTLGGIAAAAGGVRAALLVDAATFAAVALAALSLRPRAVIRDAAAGRGRMRDGVTHLFADRALALVMAAAFASLLFMTASAPAEVFFAKDVLHTGDVGFGVWLTAWPLGMALGAALVGRHIRGDLAAAALGAILLQGIGLAGPALVATLAFSIASFVVGGVAHGAKNVAVRSLLHERVPEHLHGRAYAAYNGLRNSAELCAMLMGGVLVTAAGARATLLAAGAVPALVGLGCLGGYVRARARPPAPAES